jgi:hypothetical protein
MEVIMAYFKVLSWHFLGGTKENHEKPQSGQLVSRPRRINLTVSEALPIGNMKNNFSFKHISA